MKLHSAFCLCRVFVISSLLICDSCDDLE